MATCEFFDVIIVGAGPAGTTAAIELASQGVRVLILDKKQFPRSKTCAGLLTWKTVRLIQKRLKINIAQLSQNGIVHFKSRRYAIHNRHYKIVEGRLDFPFHYVDRKRYDHHLLNLARAAGAHTRLGIEVRTLEDGNRIVLKNQRQELRGRFIIGADGVLSRIKRHLKATVAGYPQTSCQLANAIEAKVPITLLPDGQPMPTLYFDVVPWGYAWQFPGNSYYTIGMCGMKGKSARGISTHFNAFFGLQKGLPVNDLNCHAALIPYGNYMETVGYGNVLLTGDACGLADPLLGEGIYYAHKSGILAADAVMTSLRHDQPALEIYRELLKKTVLRELTYIKNIRWIVFNLLRGFNYRLLGLCVNLGQKTIERAVQGQRSFQLLKTECAIE